MKTATLFAKIFKTKEKKQIAIANDVHALIVITAESQLGIANYDLDENHYGEVLEQSEISEATFQMNVEIVKDRHAKKILADKILIFKQAAIKTEQDVVEECRAEELRQQQARVKIESLKTASSIAATQYAAAEAAKAELIAGAKTLDLEKPLGDELADINASIRRIALAADPNYVGRPIETARGGMSPGGTLWADMQTATAGLLRQTQRALETTTDPANRARLESQAKAAEQKLHNDSKDLTALEKRRDAINKQLSELVAEKLKPENFRIRKATPSRDEQAKQLAQSMGYGAEQRK
jgi:hypothetical protein